MRRTLAIAAALLALMLLLAALSLTLGPGNVRLADAFSGDVTAATIVFGLRLPRILMGMLAGAALAVSGALMQTFFRNPLAEPYITGVSAGSALGAVAGSLLGFAGGLATAACATLGGALVTAALYLFAMRRQGRSPLAVLLLGLALGTLCGALVWFLLLRTPGKTDQAISWLLGSVATVRYQEVLILAPLVLLGLAIALYFVPELDTLLLGDEKAASLGVNTLAARRGILGAATLLAAACVAFCGVIAFVGLMVPHVLRWGVGARHARLLPLCALGGAVMVLAMDLAARLVAPPREIPLTILTSLLGAPFFIVVLLRSREVQV